MSLATIWEKAHAEWEALQGSTHILVSSATCGRAAGSTDVVDALGKELARRGLEVPIIQVGCMELCYADPLVIIRKPDSLSVAYANVTPELVPRLVDGYVAGDDPCLELALGTFEGGEDEPAYIPELPRYEHEHRLVLRRCGYIDPENIRHYVATGGYSGLERALKMSPGDIIAELKRSGLRGRGGAGFPVHRKWEQCRRAKGEPKYVICNADEGDPGAFMDRVVLESDPHQVIEGMIIAGYAVGAERGYVYVRAEYPLAIKRVRIALEQAAEAGLL
ncbi:MAG: NADH-quinone oxidoreductase subunit F, partial [Dehalococcoidia bacterium]